MSDLRALIRLKEKELRCLEWSLMAQKAQEVAGGGLVAENLREELDDCKAEQQVGQTPSCQVRRSQGELNVEGAGRGSTVADPIQIWVLHMGNHSPTKAESLQAERYFRFTRSSAGAVLSSQHRFSPYRSPPPPSGGGQTATAQPFCVNNGKLLGSAQKSRLLINPTVVRDCSRGCATVRQSWAVPGMSPQPGPF